MPDDSGYGQPEHGQAEGYGQAEYGQPRYGAGQPGYDPGQPGYDPGQPGYDPSQPGQPGQPAQPGQPGQPGYGQPAPRYGHPGGYSYGGGYGPGGYGPGGYGAGGYGGYGNYGPPPPPPASRRRGAMTHVLVAVLAAALAAGGVLAFDQSGSGNANTPVSYSPGAGAVPNPGTGSGSGGSGSAGSGSEQNVVNKVEPGIVIINTSLQYDSEAAAGTGMVINSDGLVLTNNHVIESSTKISATVVSTGKTYPAEVIGYDKTGDVALIRLEGASGLRTVPIGDASALKTGTPVVALGNAEGQSAIVPAAGQITGLNKSITASDQGGSVSTETLHGMLETNAGIVSGDSGGPLSTTAGQVIGMDTAGDSSSSLGGDLGSPGQSTGFAIPINTALAVARQIAAGQASSTVTIGYPPFVGIYVAPGTSSNPQVQAQQQEQQQGGGLGGFGGSGGSGGTPSCYTSDANLSLPASIAPVSSGSLVDGTICGSPAASAGLTAGSVVTAVNGQAVGAPTTLTSILSKFKPGETISVSWVSPSGQHTTSHLHLIAGPPQ